jgi:ribosomal protein S18 acetylase RimI-like enzyme
MSHLDIERITKFIHTHYDCKISQQGIRQSILFAAKEIPGLGGYVFVEEDEGKIIGALVINRTGMRIYHSENYLAFLVVHKNFRLKGIGSNLMIRAISYCEGGISLKIDKNNKAKKLFKKIGFTSGKLSMTYNKI